MEKKFCTNCGAEIAESSAFCGACGTAVKIPQQEPRPEDDILLKIVPPVLEQGDLQIPEGTSEIPIQETPVYQEPVQEEPAYQEQMQQTSLHQGPVWQEPVQQAAVQYAAPVAPAPKKTVKVYPKRKAGTVFGSVMLCILVFIFAAAFTLIVGFRAATTQDSGEELVKEMIQAVDITEIPAASLVAEKDYEGSVADWIVEKAKAENNGKEQFDERDFEKYVEESKLVQELSEHFGSIVWNVREGEDSEKLNTDDIRKLLEDDRKMIKKHLNFNITDKDINKVVAEVERAKVLEYTSTEFLQDKAGSVYYSVQYGLSEVTLLAVAALLLVSILLVFLVNGWKLPPIFGDLGITFTVFGILFAGVTLGIKALGGMLFQKLGNFSFIGGGISNMMDCFLLPSFVILAVGIVLLIVKSLVKKLLTKN